MSVQLLSERCTTYLYIHDLYSHSRQKVVGFKIRRLTNLYLAIELQFETRRAVWDYFEVTRDRRVVFLFKTGTRICPYGPNH
jgi:hypothetical protein